MNRQIIKKRTDRKSLGLLGSGHIKGFRFRHLPLAFLVVGILLATLQYITLHQNVGFNPGRIGIKIPAQSVSEEQYLYYFTHSGWSNQLTALYHAAQLAYSTNRTLIVPPILSHKTTNDMGNARDGNFALRCGPDHLNNERRKVAGWLGGWLGGWVAPKSPVLPPGVAFRKSPLRGFFLSLEWCNEKKFPFSKLPVFLFPNCPF